MSQPPPEIVRVSPVSRRSLTNTITAAEALKRGFYGGFGLWCSFMVLNLISILLIVALLAMLGAFSYLADSKEGARPPARAPVTHREASPSR